MGPHAGRHRRLERREDGRTLEVRQDGSCARPRGVTGGDRKVRSRDGHEGIGFCYVGSRAGGIYLWESRADAERVYTADWIKFVEGKYGTPPTIEYLHAPVMVDNREGSISVAA